MALPMPTAEARLGRPEKSIFDAPPVVSRDVSHGPATSCHVADAVRRTNCTDAAAVSTASVREPCEERSAEKG